MRGKELRMVQENQATVKLESKIENLQRKQNWTAKSTSLKENAEMSSQFLSSEQPCEPKNLDLVLNIAGVDKIRLENLRLRSTLDAIRFEFWMKRALVTVEIYVLCDW